MPMYCYENRDGFVIDRQFPMGEAPKTVSEDGVKYHRCLSAEAKGVPSSKGWPMTCFASGVHPSQADDLRKTLSDAGVPTRVTKDGDPIYENPTHRKKALKARGLVDRSAYA